ncbi:MAG: glycosyltransferase [Paracoccaceae bacterium]|nr:glycosyltransferase [Paracoccaceae bacterium]
MRPQPLQSITSSAIPRRTAQPSKSGHLVQILRDTGALGVDDMHRALAIHAAKRLRLADILLTHGMVSPADLLAAEAEVWRAAVIDPLAYPPDPAVIDTLGAEACLRDSLLPWRNFGGSTVILTTKPDLFQRYEADLTRLFGPVTMALTATNSFHTALLSLRKASLNHRAETLVPEAESCRPWRTAPIRRLAIVLGVVTLILASFAPIVLASILAGWAVITLALTATLKAAAAITELHARFRFPAIADPPTIARMPCVSIMVPLFRETHVASKLVKRLERLTYPREKLDVLLVVEEEDELTHAAIAKDGIPPWMRVVTVPAGPHKTKPRALNYALPYCRGTIIGIYDAEDAPDPDQISRVVHRFYQRGPKVACLQGILDFYNPRTNWLSRCFTIEYAAWFRVVLPGLEKMGLPIPLGGTTLFFRRAAIEALGGWDAHNVTEDADLGIRLARHGYRAELLPTVTEEEANCRALPWVKQRSRWLKGYMMTWAVHMRAPRLLLQQLGWWRFFGFQVLFIGTLSQFLLAPVLWSFWLLSLGLWHPLGYMPAPLLYAMLALFALSELTNITVNAIGVSGPKHRFLIPWVPTLTLYFPLGALAAYKGAWELVTKPFYWDKTTHGLHEDASAPAPITASEPRPRRS